MPAKKKNKALEADDWLNGGAVEEGEAFDSLAGTIVNKSRLGTITGLSQATIDRALADGAPVVGKGTRKQGWQINTADFFGWYVRKKVGEVEGQGNEERASFDQAKTRAMLAQADQREMDNRVKRGQLVTIEEACAVHREEATTVRANLMAIPGRIAAAVPKEVATEVEAIASDEINAALMNITGDRPETWIGESGDDDDRESDS